jgi:hypothetical protein
MILNKPTSNGTWWALRDDGRVEFIDIRVDFERWASIKCFLKWQKVEVPTFKE